jgi:putative transposase
MARRSRGGGRLVGLVTHSDAGSQFTSVRFTERVDEIGARPSIGTVADSYDNALAETTNGLYKAECVYGPDTTGWDGVDELELATLSWVHWSRYAGDPRAVRAVRPGWVMWPSHRALSAPMKAPVLA